MAKQRRGQGRRRSPEEEQAAKLARSLEKVLAETRDIEARAFEHIREAIPVEHLQRYLSQ